MNENQNNIITKEDILNFIEKYNELEPKPKEMILRVENIVGMKVKETKIITYESYIKILEEWVKELEEEIQTKQEKIEDIKREIKELKY